MSRIWLRALALGLTATSAFAGASGALALPKERPDARQAANAPISAQIVEYGVTTAIDTGERETAPETLAGHTKLVNDPRIVQRTRHVCGEVGRSFGIWFEVKTRTGRLPADVTVRTGYPRITTPDGRASVEGRVAARVTSNPHYIGWTFDEEWELVAGRWTIGVYAGEKLLAEQSFDVTVGRCDLTS